MTLRLASMQMTAPFASFRSYFDNYALIWGSSPCLLLAVAVQDMFAGGKAPENHHQRDSGGKFAPSACFGLVSCTLIECYEVICIFVVYVENKISLLTLLNLFANANGNGKWQGKRGKRRRIEPSRRGERRCRKILLTEAVSLPQWVLDLFAPAMPPMYLEKILARLRG